VSVFGGSPPGPGPHLEDVLSAYLDDELAPAARREAEAHLAGCAECREELDDVAAARQAIRIMPVHGAPRPIVDPVLVPAAGSRRRAVWALVAAAAAAAAFVTPREPEITPSLPSLAGSHAARASITGDPLTQLAPIAVPVSFGP
jgi:anti-sigma factor RsiW